MNMECLDKIHRSLRPVASRLMKEGFVLGTREYYPHKFFVKFPGDGYELWICSNTLEDNDEKSSYWIIFDDYHDYYKKHGSDYTLREMDRFIARVREIEKSHK